MKRQIKFVFIYISAILLFIGCTTTKNTWLTRGTNAFSTRFNVYFNGYQSYKEGIDNINKAQKDNYSQLLPMYPISIHSNASAGTGKMNTTIEKCRKAIKLRSIKVKPAKNYNKTRDPKYIAFMSKEEYNPMISQAWLLLAQAEFHKADFLGAMGTYAYIVKHFSTEADVVNEAQIGRARCFTEMGWYYEAEDALNKVGRKNTHNLVVNGHYAATSADLLLKEKKYSEATPFLKTAIDNESNNYLKNRFNFILGQLSTILGDKVAAYNAYTAVIKASPTYEMEFAARLQRAQVAGDKTDKVLKELYKMAKSPKNKEYIDRIYVVMGTIYLQENNKKKAIECYEKAINAKTPDNFDKMTANIKLGDLYYNDKIYLKAQPCYAAAARTIKSDHDDFERVTKRAEILNALAGFSNTVLLQDSLQAIAKLPEKEQLATIDKIISRIRKQEQEASKALAAAQQQQTRLQLMQNNNNGFPTMGGQQNTVTATAGNNSWYFYNTATVASGITQFQQIWGSRKLEDDWRRTDKTSIAQNLETVTQAGAAQTDSAKIKAENDKYKPTFYLAQLPLTPEAIAKSNLLIGKSLLSMGQIYENKLEDEPMAIVTYDELYRRFGADSLWIEAYYSLYNLNTKANKTAEAERFKNLITTKFSTTKYAETLMHPEYALHQKEILLLQDSLYETTFAAYTRNEYQTVMNNYRYVNTTYPLASLMPKFSLLNALSIGKNGDTQAMKESLTELIKKYPESDVCSTAKDLLALLGQGKTVTKGSSYGSLIAQQKQELEQKANNDAPQFTATLNNRHFLLLPVTEDTININRLLYKVASYNFNRFVLKDFDIEIRKQATNLRFIIVAEFPAFGDAHHYQNGLAEDAALTKALNEANVRPVVVSEENLKALQLGQHFSDYLDFYQNTLIPAQAALESKQQK